MKTGKWSKFAHALQDPLEPVQVVRLRVFTRIAAPTMVAMANATAMYIDSVPVKEVPVVPGLVSSEAVF